MSYSPTKLISIKAPWRCLGSAEFLVQEAFVGSAKGSKNADIAETKNPGKHLPTTSEAELRLSLRQAIEARDIADGHARDAKEVADKADHLSRQ